MMPQMDGYELCEKVKTSDIIGDIPVVLLTAKGSDSEYLFGKQKGADLYIKKPFVPEILLEEIKQLLASRLLLKEKYSRKLVLEAGKEEITSDEEIFLKDALKIVEMNMNNVDFNPDVLASDLAMSPSSFYRKIKKTTNLTPAGFIKSIKLKKAAQLLADTNLTVSEIIERTGYIDVRSFRKNFNDQFGLNPTDFRNQHK
jgi:AraC-like DNA-binding protein